MAGERSHRADRRRGDDREGNVQPPAAQYEEIRQSFPTNQPSGYEPLMDRLLSSWTVLVKDRQLSKDGWFWANPASPGPAGTNYAAQITQALVTYDFPFSFPSAGAGLGTCLRCHASAEKELTFSTTNNILGFGGEPLRFLNDNSWRTERFFTNRAQALVEALARLPHLTNLFELPRWLRPWTDANAALDKATAPLAKLRGVHIPQAPAPTRQPGDFHLLQADKVFLATFPFKGVVTQARAFPVSQPIGLRQAQAAPNTTLHRTIAWDVTAAWAERPTACRCSYRRGRTMAMGSMSPNTGNGAGRRWV